MTMATLLLLLCCAFFLVLFEVTSVKCDAAASSSTSYPDVVRPNDNNNHVNDDALCAHNDTCRVPSNNNEDQPSSSGGAAVKTKTCIDRREQCSFWASEGHCTSSRRLYMHPHCPVSCNVCHNRTRVSTATEATDKATRYVGWGKEQRIISVVGADLGVPQRLPLETTHAAEVKQLVVEAQDYFINTIQAEDRYRSVVSLCRNHADDCAIRAWQGECDDNDDAESYNDMRQNCAPLCHVCDQLHLDTKCPVDRNMKNAWYAGDLNDMFTRLVSNETIQRQYTPTIHSHPASFAPNENMSHNNNNTNGKLSTDGPWIISLENFLSPAECERLIELGSKRGYERSTGVGDVIEDGSVEELEMIDRTSSNAWCHDECGYDPVVLDLFQRMEELTNIPSSHSEALQLLYYEVGQFYKTHNDYLDGIVDRVQGVRMLTFFLYLNDVEEGGETAFTIQNLAVQPKRGRAVLWPSVLNDHPHLPDYRTNHAARPVLKGIKYGCNAWFHQRDLVHAASMDC